MMYSLQCVRNALHVALCAATLQIPRLLQQYLLVERKRNIHHQADYYLIPTLGISD